VLKKEVNMVFLAIGASRELLPTVGSALFSILRQTFAK
jgi:hypothetical protein